jgi:cell wall-associated NlpC family hydrolase
MHRPSNRCGFTFVLILSLAACATPPSSLESDSGAGSMSAQPPERNDREPVTGRGSDRSADVVMVAMHYLDLPYRSGGQESESGFDCSGFTRQVFEQSLGVLLPRQADEQARAAGLHTVRREQLRAGDLVFFNTLGRTYSHVGIYIGDARFIHAPRSGTRIRVESLASDYWARRFTGARRPVPRPQIQDPLIAG